VFGFHWASLARRALLKPKLEPTSITSFLGSNQHPACFKWPCWNELMLFYFWGMQANVYILEVWVRKCDRHHFKCFLYIS
jgi:hypothetical protein